MSLHAQDTIRRRLTLFVFLFGMAMFNHVSSGAPAVIVGNTSQIQEGQAVAGRIQTNTERLQRSQQLNQRLRKTLASIPEPSHEEEDKAADQHRILQSHLSTLKKTLDEFTAANSIGNLSIAKLEKQLANVDKKREELVKKQTDLLIQKNPTNNAKGLRREVLLRHLKPISIKLVKNRVVPVMEPFYSVRQAPLTLALSGKTVQGIVISRVYDGESVANAIHPGGLLDKLIKKADPQKQYFRLLVCADSISAFYTVAQVVSKRGFAYSWDTSNDKDILETLEQAQKNAQLQMTDRGYEPTTTK